MDELELKRIRECANKATQGPWSADGIGSEGYDINVITPGMTLQDRWQTLGFRGCVAEVRAGRNWQEIRANAEFIAWCRDGVPKLLDEIEHLREAVKWYAMHTVGRRNEMDTWNLKHGTHRMLDLTKVNAHVDALDGDNP